MIKALQTYTLEKTVFYEEVNLHFLQDKRITERIVSLNTLKPLSKIEGKCACAEELIIRKLIKTKPKTY